MSTYTKGQKVNYTTAGGTTVVATIEREPKPSRQHEVAVISYIDTDAKPARIVAHSVFTARLTPINN